MQGGAADIFKLAMVNLDERLEAAGLAARMVLTVHDEVVLEAPHAESDAVIAWCGRSWNRCAPWPYP